MDFPESVKLEAKRLAHYCCVFCQQVVFLEVHHITPPGEGGRADLDNAAPLCPSHHTLYGDNPSMRKFVREARDFWWAHCAKRESQPDTIALRERLDTLQSQIAAGHQELLGEFKAILSDQLRVAAAAVSSARTVQEAADASTSLRATVRGPTVTLSGDLTVYPSTRSKGP